MAEGEMHCLEDSFVECTPPKVKNVRVEDTTISQSASQLDQEWRGVPLENLKISNLRDLYPPVKPSDSHTVLFKVPITPNRVPEVFPERPVDKWDSRHVRMPHSSQSLSPVSDTELRSRWALICEAFSKPIKTSQELESAILHYNSKYADRWKFKYLHHFFETTLQEEETEYFFENVLPGIIRLALSLPELITGPIPLLRQNQTHSISLSQKQVACLLANAFLCTFPRRNTTKTLSEYKNYPDINFNRLFTFAHGDHVQEKLKCIVNYFRRVCSKCPEGVVTYSRHYVSPNDLPNWSESNSRIPQLHVTSVGTIEDEGTGMLELDFANKNIGGGVLGRGCVQEEIRFVICPELIVARLFSERLDPTEALIITGVERFNNYTGYSSSFKWAGDIKDQTPRDCYGRRTCVMLAVDALKFPRAEKQYLPENIFREINKAYAGFSWGSGDKRPKLNIATGNWGCGVYGGDAQLKTLLQLMAAAQIGRNVAYFTFSNPDLRDKIGDMHKFLVNNKVTVGSLWKLLCSYHNCDLKKIDVYSYVYHSLINKSGVKSNNLSSQKGKEQKLFCVDEPSGNSSRNCGGLSTEEINATLAAMETDDGFMDLKEKLPCQIECNSKSEPMEVKSYSVKSKEGRDRCIQQQNNSWSRIEKCKKDFTEFNIVDDDSFSESWDRLEKSSVKTNSKHSKDSQSPGVAKRKISDYFKATPKP